MISKASIATMASNSVHKILYEDPHGSIFLTREISGTVRDCEQSLFPLTDSGSKKNTRAITKITSRVRGNVTRATIHVRHVSTRQAIFALFCFCLTIPKRKKRLLVIYCSNGQLCSNVNKLRLTGSKKFRFPIISRPSQFYQL